MSNPNNTVSFDRGIKCHGCGRIVPQYYTWSSTGKPPFFCIECLTDGEYKHQPTAITTQNKESSS